MFKTKTNPPRSFPFRSGTGFKAGDMQRAKDALAVFGVLWDAHHQGVLSQRQLQPVFFRSVSDQITYRESWKCGKFWTVDAWQAALTTGNTNKLVSEHVLPRSVTLAHALTLPKDEAAQFVWENSFECVVTEEENARLPRTKGYPDDPWKRYAESEIMILDIEHPIGVWFLDDGDRTALKRHGVLHTVV